MQNKGICKNKWCRATFFYDGAEQPEQCYKCKSFDQDVSAGVTWAEKSFPSEAKPPINHQIKVISRASSIK